ncbi:uncharacterized protein LOC144194164 [Stigmatopora nigra]
MSDSDDVWKSPKTGMRNGLEDSTDANEFSEHELIDIVYNACNTSNAGEVSASSILEYLQRVTSQSQGQGRLVSLRQLLDPECQDPIVSREMFHLIMKQWIAQCNQDGADVSSGSEESFPEASVGLRNGLKFSTTTTTAKGTPDSQQCSCDGKELSATVSELKQAHRKLNEQNSSLMRTVAQCEDVNLQLSLEITELRAKLASSQRSAVRARSITEELEETRRGCKEAQERVSRMQASCTKLTNEVECLKVHIRRLEDKNDKLSFEKTCSEDAVNKLRKVNTELRAELQETLVMLTLKDREMTKNDILMDKMKSSHVENHNMIEGLQAELMRLHEHSHQVLLRYDRLCIGPHSLYARDPPNLRSLQSEIQDLQQQNRRTVDERSLPSLRPESDGIQNIIHRIKSSEIVHLWRNLNPERGSSPVESQEKPFPQHQKQQASIKQQLVNVLQDLELQKCAREDKGEKVDERRKAWEKEPKANQTGKPIEQSKKVAIVKWWKTISVDGTKGRGGENKSFREIAERARLRKSEEAIPDMREQVCNLQASLKCAQTAVAEPKRNNQVIVVHKETNTEKENIDERVKERRDASVATEPVGSPDGAGSRQHQVQLAVTADALIAALRRMEAMVNGALDSAKLVKESEKRVSRVSLRMESITQKVEAALGRTADADMQLNLLEARIGEKNTNQKLSSPEMSAGPDHSAEFITQDDGQMDSPPPCVIPEVNEFPQFPMNGDTKQDNCDKLPGVKEGLRLKKRQGTEGMGEGSRDQQAGGNF